MKLFNLTDKVALITGGNGGIGFAMAKAIGEAGATVVIACYNNSCASFSNCFCHRKTYTTVTACN